MKIHSVILQVLENDADLLRELRAHGVLPLHDDELATEHVEIARVSYTLVRELDVNWAGVEIVLRMRSELIGARAQVAALLSLLREKIKKGT